MKRLRFVVKGKRFTTFADTSITFLREVQTAKPHGVPYTTGNGYQVANGTALLTEGVDGQVNYLNIVVDGDQTITASGTLNLLITHFPNATQAAQVRNLSLDGSNIKINFLYNSRPVILDVDIEVDNRTNKVVTLAHFDGRWSDYDNDAIAFITIYNSDSNLRFNGAVYVPGTPISAADINAGKLVYVPDDVDNQYNDDYSYTITDTAGNVSN